MKDIDIKKYNANKYVRIKIYLFSESDNEAIALIEREFYIINNLTIKALIKINIIKSKDIVINLEKNVIKIELY